MAKPNYQFEKRQRDIAKKKKQDEKRSRKLSKDEVLLQQSQLQTGYRANYRLALNYTFGSVLNNVVNPRLTGNSDS